MAFGKKPSATAPPSPVQPAESPVGAEPSRKPTASGPPPRKEDDPPPPDVLAARILAWFEEAFADKRGVHIETLLAALGAMSGFGCQIAVREAMMLGRLPPDSLVEIKTVDGGRYWFGDQPNQPLIEAHISVWKLVAGGAQHAGATQLPDISEIAAHVARSVGSPAFGVLRVPPSHQPSTSPLQALKDNWTTAYKFIKACNGDFMMTGWYFATAAQQLIIKGKDVIDPALACRIVMEAAVAMAKVDPASIGYDVREGPGWRFARPQSS